MAKKPRSKYSLRSQLFFLAGITFLLCTAVMLLFFPLLNMTLEGLQDRSIKSMQEAKEIEASTIARLMVLELSRVKDLLKVTAEANPEIDQNIMNLLWEKVTFNVVIEGIELIQGQKDAEGKHVTFLYYRRETPKLKPMLGPQKVPKKFSGLEDELLDAINTYQKTDKNLLESVNRGPKEEGEMLFRFFPVHVLLKEEGAVYWGVAKIGINTTRVRRIIADQSQEQDRVRKAIWLEIILSLTISGVLAMTLIYYWVHNLTEPLKNLGAVARDLHGAQPQEFELWLENLKRVKHQEQAEVASIQEVLLRLGNAIPKLGQRLITGERRACMGKVVARALPVLQGWGARLSTLEEQLAKRYQAPVASTPDSQASGPPESAPLETLLQERAELMEKLSTVCQDLARFWPAGEVEWEKFDLIPGVQSAWRLATLGLPPDLKLSQGIQPLPLVWGSPVDLPQAVLFLLDFAVEYLGPAGELGLQTRTVSDWWVQIIVSDTGPEISPAECQDWLNPRQANGEVREQLGPVLAAAIASQHGGSLKVQPGEQGGFLFYLEIPRVAATDEYFEPYI